MNKFVEEAVIVETYETEPKRSIETVRPEVIGEKKPRKRRRSGGGLFDAFFSGSIFSDIFDIFDTFDDMFDLEEDNPWNNRTPDPESTEPEPETALIVETNEANVREVRYAYAEILDE